MHQLSLVDHIKQGGRFHVCLLAMRWPGENGRGRVIAQRLISTQPNLRVLYLALSAFEPFGPGVLYS